MAACTIDTSARETNGNNQAQNQAQDQAQSAEPKPPAVSVKDGATGVNPADRVVVKSLGEGLTKVTMTNEAGKQVEGKLAEDKRSWSTAEDLGFNRTYKVVAADVNGETSTVSFSTVAPAATSFASLAPLDGATVGVAQVIALRFDTAIKNRQEVQNAIKVTTTPEVEGAFHWVSNQEVRWRPAQFWQPGTQVTVEADLYGLNLGGGVYGENDNGASFTIGDRVEAIADDATKQMVILKNGETVKTMPISMGTDRWATPNGVYTIGDEYETLLMDSTTYGLALDAGGYQTNVKYATQMSYSGIFVHAAPWSEWAQGSSNQSHGCINVSTENARWFQEFFKRGDIVTVKNTVGGTLSPYDGLGDWNMDWATWKAGNADA
ncbi:L,D-transpeptidase [Corynebacterium kozikiae]|uniref:L,D-transpeptidase n=1 Tax=Corynebacterium kozikiae TaxID=2968469 RepID=UPI00211C598B|nr:Ig-like domain-containing protein [Corynebacterium sp. 76QC2CO]MCQ9343261.1 Ig-like domain-containing protein [Corynebacterium sp. 76QC2CO]